MTVALVDNIKKIIPDHIYLKYKFRKLMGYPLNLRNPQTFNEKLQWLKLHDRKPIYTTMVDKYEAKKYVASVIGSQYIIPTLGVWNQFDEIPFEKLPNQFVLKTTHDSGSVVIVNNKEYFLKNKNCYNAARNKLNESLKHNFYYAFREWPYKNVKPRIIAEKYITDNKHSVPNDYKVFTFNGEFDSVMVCTDRNKGHAKFRFYDENWNRKIYMKPELEPNDDIERPANLEEIIQISEKLGYGHPHLRIDLYDINGKIYFGELTFFDQCGYDTDITYNTDIYWGNKIDLRLVKENI